MTTTGFSVIAPRVVDENHGGSIPLVDRIQGLFQAKRLPIVALTGDGKTTALRFVAEYFADDIASGRLALTIVDEEFLLGDFSQHSLMLTSSPKRRPQQTLSLANWGLDEFIQYLLANHPTLNISFSYAIFLLESAEIPTRVKSEFFILSKHSSQRREQLLRLILIGNRAIAD